MSCSWTTAIGSVASATLATIAVCFSHEQKTNIVRATSAACGSFSSAVSSFGGGMIMQLSWHACGLISSTTCSGSISSAIIDIRLAGLALLFVQIALLSEHRDLKCFVYLAVPASLCNIVGVALLQYIEGDAAYTRFFQVSIGIFFLAIAVHRAWSLRHYDSEETFMQSNRESQVELHPLHGSTSQSSTLSRKGSTHLISRMPSSIPSLASEGGDWLFQAESESPCGNLGMLETWAWGAGSGLMAGLVGTSGLVLTGFVFRSGMSKDAWRATAPLLFQLENLISLTTFAIVNPSVFAEPQDDSSISLEHLAIRWAVLFFGGLGGLLVGNALAEHMDMISFSTFVICLLCVGSFSMLFG